MRHEFGSGWDVGDIRLRRDLVAQGWTDADLHALVARGTLRRITYGVLAVGARPEDPVAEHAQRATGIARLHGADIAVSGASALVLHALPLRGYVHLAGRVQAVRLRGGTRSTRHLLVARPRVAPPALRIPGGGLSVDPTVAALQVAAQVPHPLAVVVLDACLHAGLVQRTGLLEAARELAGHRGAGAVRAAVTRCRVGAQSPKETQLRLFVEDLGFTVTTQFPVVAGPGEAPLAWADLRVDGTRLLLEYDGELKYAAGGVAPLLAEKQREDRIRRLGWGLERVVDRDLTAPRSLGRRIVAAARLWAEVA